MSGQMVEFASDGSSARGYLAKPAGGSGPGVIVLQEWWGLVDHIKAVADRFAAEGFVALAPDLYQGKSTNRPDEAGRLMMALDIARAVRDVRGAISYLLERGGARPGSVAIIGFCMGGQLALATACADARVGACADFYGVHPQAKLDLASLRAPVLGIFAENDGFVTPAVARKLEADLQAAGKRTDFHIFRGVDHAFFNDSRPDVYDAAAASAAWQRALQFFQANLG
jgi:carboxymethylenebutenolidase